MPSITLLVENTARGMGVLGEHGLAWWIDTGSHRVLFDTGQGMAVVFGCAHAGSVNTLWHIASLTNNAPIRAVFGGLHLENASAHRIDETVRALRSCRPQKMGFCHCTGFHALRHLWDESPDACVQANAGMRMEFV